LGEKLFYLFSLLFLDPAPQQRLCEGAVKRSSAIDILWENQDNEIQISIA